MNEHEPHAPTPVPRALAGDPHTREDVLALLQQLLTGVAGIPVATTVAKPFQFPSLEHLDARVFEVLQRAENVEGLSKKSTCGYRSAYRLFRAYLLGTNAADTFLAGQLTDQARILEGWIAWLRGRGANHTTVNSYWRALHAPLARIAHDAGSVAPTRFVATPKPGRPLPRFLTREALDRVVRFVRNYQWLGGDFERTRNIALLLTMALGGCRKGEVLRLKVEDVDCQANTIRITRGKGRHGGKGRVICLPPALNRAMAEYLAQRQARGLATDRVFVSVRGDHAIGDITIRRLCTFITRTTGVHVAPHLLRHTCATLLRQSGVPDRLSMEQLGHASLGVLQRYSHVAPGERQHVIALLDLDPGTEHADEAVLNAGPQRGTTECSSLSTEIERSTVP